MVFGNEANSVQSHFLGPNLIPSWGRRFPTSTRVSLGTNWESYDPTQFSHHLPEDSIPPTPQGSLSPARCGAVSLLEGLTGRKETFSLWIIGLLEKDTTLEQPDGREAQDEEWGKGPRLHALSEHASLPAPPSGHRPEVTLQLPREPSMNAQ